jgi:multiple sugar transport system substrate-binding protein
VYVDKTAGSEQMYRVFNSGHMAMVPTGPWELPEIVQAKVDYGVAPLPSFSGTPTTISGPDGWMLFDNGPARAKAAETFVQWLTQPAQDAAWDVNAGSLPLRKSTAQQPVWKKHQASLAGLSTFVDALASARVRPAIEAYPKLSHALGQQIVAMLLGTSAPPAALAKAISGANDALSSGE